MSSGLRPGDAIAGWPVENPGARNPRTGLVVEAAEEPVDGRWRVTIECRDTRKTTKTDTRTYDVWWPVVG